MSRIALVLIAASLFAPTTTFAQTSGAQTSGAQTSGAQTGTVSPEDDATVGTTGTAASGTDTTASTTSTEPTGSLSDEQALLEEREAPPAQRSGFEPGEVEGETYIFVGLLARAQIIPYYPFEVASQIAYDYDTPVNGAGGVYFNYRRNGFNVLLEVYYQGMEWEGFVRSSGDPESETEYIRSRLGIVYGYVGFGWAFDLADWFAIELGFGLGLGGLIGDLYRQEAYGGPGAWQACAGPDMPAGTASGDYCEASVERPNPENGRLDDGRVRGGTYGLGVGGTGPNPHYFGPGGVPPIFATIDLPRLSFRFKPIHQMQIRIDTAFNGYGISLGGSIGYGF